MSVAQAEGVFCSWQTMGILPSETSRHPRRLVLDLMAYQFLNAILRGILKS